MTGFIEMERFRFLERDGKNCHKSKKFYGRVKIVKGDSQIVLEDQIDRLDGKGGKIRFPVKGGPENVCFNVCVRRKRKFHTDEDIGEVNVPFTNLFHSTGSEGVSFDFTYPVVGKPGGLFSGQLTFSFRFVGIPTEGTPASSLPLPDQHRPKKRYVAVLLGAGLLGDLAVAAAESGFS